VIAPFDAADAKGLLKAAIRCPDPVVFLENELLYGRSFEVPEGEHVVEIGRARLHRPGRDVTLVSYSIGVEVALEAATQLAAVGIEAEVLDLRTLRPLDEASIVAALQRTHRMVVVEEGWPRCSIASEVMAIAMEKGFDELDAPVLRVTDADVPLPYAANLEKAALVKAADVVAAVRSIV
jgi:pyruvate dehydrogenase E1 component beta subunit